VRLRVPEAHTALLAWAAIWVIGGLGTGYSRNARPLLERDRVHASGDLDPELTRLKSVRDESVSRLHEELMEAKAAWLLDSLKPAAPGVTFDVRLPDPDQQRTAEAEFRRRWQELAVAPAAAARIVLALRPTQVGQGGRRVAFDDGSCRLVVLLPRYENARGSMEGYARMVSDYLRRGIGTCLFFARYGAPGAAARSVLALVDQPSSLPCRLKSGVVRRNCRNLLLDGPPLPSTVRALTWFWTGHPLGLACGARRPGACEAWYAPGVFVEGSFKGWREWELSWFLPALELKLGVEGFAKFWKSNETMPRAIEAVTGRPADVTLAAIAVPAYAKYSPGPALRLPEAVIAMALIVLAVSGAVLTFQRRRAANS
jgi:hypothetical protein